MSKHEQVYRLIRRGRLLIARAAISDGQGGVVAVRLLVDTGSSYTVLPFEVVEAAGCDTHHASGRAQIVTANGTIVAPKVTLPWFHCLGCRVEHFTAVAHTLPSGTFVDGLLGVDFPDRCRATISFAQGTIRVEPI